MAVSAGAPVGEPLPGVVPVGATGAVVAVPVTPVAAESVAAELVPEAAEDVVPAAATDVVDPAGAVDWVLVVCDEVVVEEEAI